MSQTRGLNKSRLEATGLLVWCFFCYFMMPPGKTRWDEGRPNSDKGLISSDLCNAAVSTCLLIGFLSSIQVRALWQTQVLPWLFFHWTIFNNGLLLSLFSHWESVLSQSLWWQNMRPNEYIHGEQNTFFFEMPPVLQSKFSHTHIL